MVNVLFWQCASSCHAAKFVSVGCLKISSKPVPLKSRLTDWMQPVIKTELLRAWFSPHAVVEGWQVQNWQPPPVARWESWWWSRTGRLHPDRWRREQGSGDWYFCYERHTVWQSEPASENKCILFWTHFQPGEQCQVQNSSYFLPCKVDCRSSVSYILADCVSTGFEHCKVQMISIKTTQLQLCLMEGWETCESRIWQVGKPWWLTSADSLRVPHHSSHLGWIILLKVFSAKMQSWGPPVRSYCQSLQDTRTNKQSTRNNNHKYIREPCVCDHLWIKEWRMSTLVPHL